MEDEREQPRPEVERSDPEQDKQARIAAKEPECEGGDSPCWAHMLDDDGHLS